MQAKRLLKEERVETELLEGDEDKQEKKVSTFKLVIYISSASDKSGY